MLKRKLGETPSFILCLIVALLMFLLLKLKLPALMVLISLFLIIITIRNLAIGLVLMMIIFPLTPIVSGLVVNIPTLFNPAFAIGVVFNILLRRNSLRHHKGTLFSFLLILVPTVMVSFFYQHYSSINTVINFILVVFISYVVSISYLNYENLNRKFVIALLLSGLVAFSFAISGDMDSSRLQVDDNVRRLSNVLGLSITVIVLTLLFYKEKIHSRLKYFLLIGLVPLVAGLIMTVSRGVILSTTITILLSSLFYFFFIGKLKKLFSMIFNLGLFLTAVYFIAYDYFIANYGKYLLIFDKRFQGEQVASGAGIREYIWIQVLETFNDVELLFGVGIDGFTYKSRLAGVNFYSHSVFVDALASAGIVVFIILVFILIKNLFIAYKMRNVFSFGMLVFLIFNFVTHGSIVSPIFWLGLAMAIGTRLRYSNAKVS